MPFFIANLKCKQKLVEIEKKKRQNEGKTFFFGTVFTGISFPCGTRNH